MSAFMVPGRWRVCAGSVRRWLRAFGSSRGAVSVDADETDEAGEGDEAHAVQRVVAPFEQDHLFVAAGPDGLYEATVGRELVNERRGHLREGGGDDDAVERGVFGQSQASVAGHDVGVDYAGRGEVAARRRGEARQPLDAPREARHVRQERRLVTEPRANLEDDVVVARVERVDHRGHQRRLRGHLVVTDRYRFVIGGEVHPIGRHEIGARDDANSVEKTDVVDPRRRGELGEIVARLHHDLLRRSSCCRCETWIEWSNLRDGVELTVEFYSPFWAELRWREATIALHGGGTGDERDSWLGLHVTDVDAALAEAETAGGRRGNEREGTAPTVTAMRVYLVQHGQAKPENEDPQRPLTDRGADDVAWVAHWAIDRFGVRPSRVIHSGKTRSRQTAEIWGRLLEVDAEEGDGLAPNDDSKAWVRRLTADTADVMLVGHLPHLAKLASLLLTGDPDGQLIGFQQGGLVALEHNDAGWIVILLLPPSAG